MHEGDANEQAAVLWRKYLTMSKELLKFIDQGDIDTFLELVDQRVALVDRMKALPPHTFRQTQEFNDLVAEIKPLDMQVIYKARAWLNRSRRNSSAVKSYDLSNLSLSPAGNLFNRKY